MNHAKTTCANITWETETETENEAETEAETETERDRERQRETEREGEIRALDDTFHNVLVSITTNGVLIIFTQSLIKKQLKNLEKDIVQRMWKDGTPPQFSKVLYTQCYAAYRGRCIFYLTKLFSRSFNYIA